MTEIVNLRGARKARARAEKDAKAAENRAAFGRTKAQKALDRAHNDKAARTLDQARRDGPEEP